MGSYGDIYMKMGIVLKGGEGNPEAITGGWRSI